MPMAQRIGGGWFAFLTMGFLIVGLTGVFATYAAPLAMEREARHEAALDQVLQDHGVSPALRATLGEDDAARLGEGTNDLAAKVAAARIASRLRFAAENAATRRRLLLLIGMVTAIAALFGAFVLQAAR